MEVWLVVLGAVLALMTSIAVEFVRGSITQRRTKSLLSTLLVDEVESIVDILGRLKSEANASGYFSFMLIGQIPAARSGFDRNRDWIILYNDEKLRRQIFKFYQDMGATAVSCDSLERGKSDPVMSKEPGWPQYY